jgi:tetratricopeptide (TPR) repeat protein
MDTSIITFLTVGVVGISFLFVNMFLKNSSRISKLSYNSNAFSDADIAPHSIPKSYAHTIFGEKAANYNGTFNNSNVSLKHNVINTGQIFKKALNKFKDSDFNAAIIYFNEVLKSNPNDKYSYYYKGLSNLELSNFMDAYNDLSTAINLGVNERDIFFNRGIAELEIGKYYEAVEDFNVYLVKNLDAVETYFYRGIAYYKCGSRNFALRDFNKAIELNPNHEKVFFDETFIKKELNNIEEYKSDLKSAYEKGYLHAYHFLRKFNLVFSKQY